MTEETFVQCPSCDCYLDMDIYPKCIICNSIKYCINCTKSKNILAVSNIVVYVCDDCILNYNDTQLEKITHLKISKSKLSKKIHKLQDKMKEHIIEF